MINRTLKIDYMYIDLNTCTRCTGTDQNLEAALSDVANILNETGVEVIVNRVLVQTEEQALELGFVSSPTIRVNDQDIQLNGKETHCESCGDICGDEVDCRVWTYRGKEYNVAPKAMIIEAILKAIYGSNEQVKEIKHNKVEEVPENLKKFFKAKHGKDVKKTKNNCCSSSNCCDSSCC